MKTNRKDLINPNNLTYHQFKNIIKQTKILASKYYQYIEPNIISDHNTKYTFHKKLLTLFQIDETEFIIRKQKEKKGNVYILKNKTFINSLLYLFKEDFQIGMNSRHHKIYNYEDMCLQIEKIMFELCI